MTIPIERTAAVLRTRQFLFELVSPQHTKRIPSKIREMARGLLKHYPSEFDFTMVTDHWVSDVKCPFSTNERSIV